MQPHKRVKLLVDATAAMQQPPCWTWGEYAVKYAVHEHLKALNAMCTSRLHARRPLQDIRMGGGMEQLCLLTTKLTRSVNWPNCCSTSYKQVMHI